MIQTDINIIGRMAKLHNDIVELIDKAPLPFTEVLFVLKKLVNDVESIANKEIAIAGATSENGANGDEGKESESKKWADELTEFVREYSEWQ